MVAILVVSADRGMGCMDSSLTTEKRAWISLLIAVRVHNKTQCLNGDHLTRRKSFKKGGLLKPPFRPFVLYIFLTNKNRKYYIYLYCHLLKTKTHIYYIQALMISLGSTIDQ
jgi:hypothetical protein